LRVRLIDEAVFAIAIVGIVGGLRARSAEERGHDGSAGIIRVHRRHAEKRFNRANHVDRGEERVIDERNGDGLVGFRKRRIFADDERDAAVRIDVVGAVLSVVFENQNSGVVPIGAVRNGLDDTAYGEIVIGDRGRRGRQALAEPGSMVVGKAQLDELRHGVIAGLAGGEESLEFVEKFIHAKLIGIGDFKVRIKRVEVAAKLGRSGDVLAKDGYVPGIGARAAVGFTDVFWKRLAFPDNGTLAKLAYDFGRAPSGRVLAFRSVAPVADDEFAVVSIGDATSGEILPKEAAGGLTRIGQAVLGGDAVQERAFGIVAVLVAAVGDGPGLLDIVGDGGGIGPDVAVTGNVATVVEIIEDAELSRQSMLVGSDVFAVHDEGRVAVGVGQVAEDLIVGAAFFDDVDDMMNLVLAGGERDFIGVAAGGIGFEDLLRVGREMRREIRERNAGERAVSHCGIVGIIRAAVAPIAPRGGIGAGAAAFCAGDEELVGRG